VAEFIDLSDGSTLSASQMLQRFLFPPSSHWTPLAKLSGGELRRLYLLKILMAAPNVLLLDEPGNDLDIQTLSLLEEYLDEFQGAVIAVSHDRYFLDRVVEKLLVFEEGGHVHEFLSYADYLQKAEEESLQHLQKEAIGAKNEKQKDKPAASVPKFSFKEQKEYEQIDEMIAQAELQLEEIQEEMNVALSDYESLQELARRQQEAEAYLDQLMERWTYLNELAEEIANHKKEHSAR
jgi:ATP-binding cassette subfamily F protein uup